MRVELHVPQGAEATKLPVDVGEAIGEGEQVRADDNLQLEVGKEEGAAAHLVTERLVGIVVADGLKVRGGVEMGREGSGKVEGKEVAIGVPGAKVPNDALSSGEEAFLTDDDGRTNLKRLVVATSITNHQSQIQKISFFLSSSKNMQKVSGGSDSQCLVPLYGGNGGPIAHGGRGW